MGFSLIGCPVIISVMPRPGSFLAMPVKNGMNWLKKMGTENEIFDDVKCVSNIYNYTP